MADGKEGKSIDVQGSPWMKQHNVSRNDCLVTRGIFAMADKCPCGRVRCSDRKYGALVVPDGTTVETQCLFHLSPPPGTEVKTESEETTLVAGNTSG